MYKVKKNNIFQKKSQKMGQDGDERHFCFIYLLLLLLLFFFFLFIYPVLISKIMTSGTLERKEKA